MDLRATALEIVRRLQAAGFGAFFVGGCVRDLLLGREPVDFDIVTSALPDQIEGLFPRTIGVGRKFGVIIVVEEDQQFQVATFRAEGDYRDGRHPERVVFGDARADAERRDFTVNGLFMDPVTDTLHDWVEGEKDLKAKLIRTIGNPEERFNEDYLRMLRAVRFAAQLGFKIEENTFTAVQANASKIKGISAERIRDELNKLFAPPHASHGLTLLNESRLLEHVLPELQATITCEQSPNYHPEGSVFNHLVLMLSKLPTEPELKTRPVTVTPEQLDAGEIKALLPWSVLLHDIAKPVTASKDPATGSIHFYGHEKVGADMAEQILERLRFPRRDTDHIVHAVRCHMQFKDAMEMRKSTVRRLLLRETFPLEIELHRLDCLGSHGSLEVYDYLLEARRQLDQRPEMIPPLLTGDELIRLGMSPGPALGKMLTELRDKQLQEELATKEEAIAWATEQLASPRDQR
jgi:poly(A) polymerase